MESRRGSLDPVSPRHRQGRRLASHGNATPECAGHRNIVPAANAAGTLLTAAGFRGSYQRGFEQSWFVPSAPQSFFAVHGRLIGQLGTQENGDLRPTATMLQGFAGTCQDLGPAVARWNTILATDVVTLNAALSTNGGRKMEIPAAMPVPKC